jgi:hypothetical protein
MEEGGRMVWAVSRLFATARPASTKIGSTSEGSLRQDDSAIG